MWRRKKEEKKKNNSKNSGHFVPQQCLRAVHALRSDQLFNSFSSSCAVLRAGEKILKKDIQP